MKYLKKTDPAIAKLIELEGKRQQNTLMMIPSENIASYAVEEAVGSCLMNKYSEGYARRRYYQGNEIVDEVETLVQDRAKKLFNVPYVNVQAHSGSPANFAVYTALLKPGDVIMGLSLASGGHLTHGANKNASSIYFKSLPYEVDEKGMIDFKTLRELAKQHKPSIIVAGTTAYARTLDWKKFAAIADEVGAYLLADISHISGLVIGGNHPSPVPHVHVVTTTTHKTLRGPRGALIMTTNKGLDKNPDLAKQINSAIIPGIQGGPHMHTIAGIGVALEEAAKPQFKKYTKQIVANAKMLAAELTKFSFNLVTGGTDNHLILIDLQNKQLLGNTMAEACEIAGIVLNRNAVPNDPNPPFFPSGIRLGTPGLTTRGMKEREMKQIASYINDVATVIEHTKKFIVGMELDKDTRRTIVNKAHKELVEIKKKVEILCKKFPLKKVYS